MSQEKKFKRYSVQRLPTSSSRFFPGLAKHGGENLRNSLDGGTACDNVIPRGERNST